jgi:acyl-homoserine lactone acylase PvdQ
MNTTRVIFFYGILIPSIAYFLLFMYKQINYQSILGG